MQYIEIDPITGVVSWDAYFDYLHSVRTQMSDELYAYAANREHYRPEGRSSLQGAWLIGVQLGYRAQEVVLAFLGAWQDRKHVLTYTGVSAYALDIDVEYRSGDRDLLTHEFRAENRVITHEVAFRSGRVIRIVAQDVIPVTELLS
jgi:hypothetical protein